MTEKNGCLENGLEALCFDLEKKAALDVAATVSLIEALEKILSGKDPDEVCLTELGRSLPGRSPMELVRDIAVMRRLNENEMDLRKMVELRDSLYRYQSVYSQG